MATQARSSASSQRARQTSKKNAATPNGQHMRRSIELTHLPPLTPEQQAELANLRTRLIDYSDIPSLPETFWHEAERGRFYKPMKASTTIRIDADVLAWLRAGGKGYQSRINAILRRKMLHATTPSPTDGSQGS